MKPCLGSPHREWLHPERFCNQPIYCEALHNPDDVLCPGSDDESYHSPADRRMRYEAQAQRFLEGKPVFLLSASLRGPFDRKSGWVNPWRSKSTSRTKSVRRRRPPASRRATVDHHESSHVPDSSGYHLRTPERQGAPPRAINTPPRYMDDESFDRVWDWRDRVLAEIQDSVSSSQNVSQTEPALLDSRLATQYFVAPVASFDGGSRSSSAPLTPSVADRTMKPGAPGISGREVNGLSPSLQDKAGQVACSGRAPASASSLSSIGPQAITEDLSPFDATDLSPHAVRIYEQLVIAERATSTNEEQRGAQNVSTESITAKKAPSMRSPAEREHAKVIESSTPCDIFPEATASSTRAKAQASSRTDGSFRYRRNDGRAILKRSRPGSKLFDSHYAPRDSDLYPTLDDQPATSRSEDKTRRTRLERKTADETLTVASESLHEVITVTTGLERRATPENTLTPMHCQPMQELDGQATEPDQSERDEEDGDTETTSQIDGPTLVPSGSASGSDHPSTPSFGHFSAEKHSQDIIYESAGFPRRLLWPKSRRSANRDSAPMFALGPELTPNSTQPESVGLGHNFPAKEVVSEPADKSEAVQVPPEGQALVNTQQDPPSVVNEGFEGHAESTVEKVRGSETGSEGEDEKLPEQEEPQVDTMADSNTSEGTESETQPASRGPELGIQSPWVKEDVAPLPGRAPDLNTSSDSEDTGDTRDTDPKAVQSPWMNQANTVPHIPHVTEQLHPSQVGTLDLSFIASQALEQAVSQSLWARGDSQIAAPEPPVFNPLSSPANSVILPIAAITQSQQLAGHEEDIDMCNSQLYPPHPSTPETKQSGLPTPDFTFPVRSFRDFMTPSPQRPAKRRRISTDTHCHLPSTQALINAAISNPWAKPSTSRPRRQKRVSWAPLPDETEPTTPAIEPDVAAADSRCGAGLSTSDANVIRTKTPTQVPRAGSPPPSILATSKLPTEANQKFAKHFAAVTNRRRRGGSSGGVAAQRTPHLQKRRLLPSESQRVCPSPAVDAMAEAFLQADAHRVDAERGASCSSSPPSSSALRDGDGRGPELAAVQEQPCMMGVEVVDDNNNDDDDEEEEDDDKENRERGPVLSLPDDEASASQLIDDVSAVMENLDDYLGGGAWDLDAELAKASAAERRREGECRESGSGLGGLMDAGV
ncbi:hypothetical protein MFIFM68171_03818 [Madurella fahalii]|uniref:Protamine P1 n=1 Tax=Madurella fahalii TaxID=1157608 RepID=A0ABQ0G771_9PEZI